MPDTLTAEPFTPDQIERWRREVANRAVDPELPWPDKDVIALVARFLAHIDALTAAVEDFVAFLNTYDEDDHPHASGEAKERAAILAILRGPQPPPGSDWTDPKG